MQCFPRRVAWVSNADKHVARFFVFLPLLFVNETDFLSIILSICLSVCLIFYLSVCLSVSLSLSLSLSLFADSALDTGTRSWFQKVTGYWLILRSLSCSVVFPQYSLSYVTSRSWSTGIGGTALSRSRTKMSTSICAPTLKIDIPDAVHMSLTWINQENMDFEVIRYLKNVLSYLIYQMMLS